ncbi:MAG: hypothetical protein K9J16_00615 [Melioribacteraceae bacterium]|nr:hypothetical protein [Melioribacteraceae bacterium]MCF8354094.1 hypothetical protein [Melioribacteraceae bacterium]MCF8393766.1 hypothetical protein [Melioribacteraceae bacterium]MCF8419510.1 hypothetical protein [Melioribacteraceae bacterium]
MIIQFQDKIDLLRTLDPDTKPLWGKMTAQHMVEHLILAVKMGNGKMNVECINPPDKLPTLKRFMMSSRPMPRGFINPMIGTELIPLEYESMNAAIEMLKKELSDYEKYFDENPGKELMNATFGPLNKKEWDVFHEKHFTHHLTQFGLINNGKEE